MNYILINYFDINDSSNIIIEGLTFTSEEDLYMTLPQLRYKISKLEL